MPVEAWTCLPSGSLGKRRPPQAEPRGPRLDCHAPPSWTRPSSKRRVSTAAIVTVGHSRGGPGFTRFINVVGLEQVLGERASGRLPPPERGRLSPVLHPSRTRLSSGICVSGWHLCPPFHTGGRLSHEVGGQARRCWSGCLRRTLSPPEPHGLGEAPSALYLSFPSPEWDKL